MGNLMNGSRPQPKSPEPTACIVRMNDEGVESPENIQCADLLKPGAGIVIERDPVVDGANDRCNGSQTPEEPAVQDRERSPLKMNDAGLPCLELAYQAPHVHAVLQALAQPEERLRQPRQRCPVCQTI